MGKQKRSRHTENLYRYRSTKPDDRKRVYRTRTFGRIRTYPHECETVRPDTGKIPESGPLRTAARLYTGHEQVRILYEQTPVLCGQERGIYTLSTIVSGQKWDNGNFWKSVGMGAVGGAIGGGLGHIGGLTSIGNSFGYNMLSNISNTIITNAIFGYDTEWSNILPIIGGAAVGSALPNFKGIKGSKFMNGLAEVGYNTLRGTATGLAAGTINAAIKQDPNQIWQGMLGGAIGGMSRSIIMNMLFGAPYQVGNTYGVEGLYRSGGIADFIDKLIDGAGITLGRNIHVRSDLNANKLEEAKYHENYHIQQQNQIGWANFYGRTLYEYMRHGVNGMTSVYGVEGTLDYEATQYAFFKIHGFRY